MYLEMMYNIFNKADATSPMTKSAVANKAFRRLAEKFINPYNRQLTKEVPAGIRYSDLNIPLKERVSGKFSSDPVEFSLKDQYKKYLARVWRKDPRIAHYNDLTAKLDKASRIRSRLNDLPNVRDAQQLKHAIMFDGYDSYMARELLPYQIPRITVYKSKVPYATTHHLADGPAALAANRAARNAPTGTRLIENPNTDEGWRDWRSPNFRVNTPGASWSPEELELMRTSSNLSNTNLYETVFSQADRNFPNAVKTYVPDTPQIRQALALKPDVKGVPIDELQSKVQGILYKGTPGDPVFMLNTETAYKDAVRRYIPDRFKNKANTILPDNSAELTHNTPERWFAPAVRTSMGYAAGRDSQKFIRLDSNALRRLRELPTITSKKLHASNVPELESYTDADWANMFRSLHQQRRMNNIIQQLVNRRANTMPENLYRLARSYRSRDLDLVL